MVKWCTIVKVKREAMGYTQADFGKVVGVSGSTIANFEQGHKVSEVIEKSIRWGLKSIEDAMDRKQRLTYEIVKEAKLLALEEDVRLINSKADNVMFACLKLRSFVNNNIVI